MWLPAWRLVVLLLALTTAGACARATSRVSAVGTPLPAPASVDRPMLVVGDHWSFRSASGARVDDTFRGRRDHALLFHRVNYAPGSTTPAVQYDRLLSDDLAVISGGGTQNRPDDGLLRFPLAVGKAWQHRYVRVVQRPQPREVEIVLNAAVKSYELISLAGVAFEAFRIESVSETSGADVPPLRATYWYAPAAKAVVKYDAEYSTVGPALATDATIGFELVDHEIKP
jgi:hypothetical protein